jgi:hypothetical protein
MFSKGSLSGGNNFGGEGQDLPLPTTLPASVPLSLISEEPAHSVRSPYVYAPSSSTPRHLPMSSLGPDTTSSVNRFVDDGRPSKTPRLSNGPSTASSGSNGGTVTSPDYRYGSFTSVHGGTGDVLASAYGADPAVGGTGTQRDVYAGQQQGWRPPSGTDSTSYGGSDGRPYGSSYDLYKHRSSDAQSKSDSGHGSHVDAYSHRGSFDSSANYSWGHH